MRETGIDPVGSVSWGTHFCIFYQTKADLRDVLVPYFKAGLENNEFCMWVTSEPLPVEEAKRSLREAVKNLDEYIENEQMEILDYTQWYTKSGKFEADKVLQGWIEKENQALERGFAGLRLAGNTFWLEKEAWRAFADYEATIDRVIGDFRIVAACTYSLDRCGASEIIDVVCRHRFALIRQEGKWEVIESAERKRAEEALRESEERSRGFAEAPFEGIIFHEEGNIIDANEVFATMFGYGLSEVIGKNALDFATPELRGLALDHIRDGSAGLYEGVAIRKDGSTFFVEVRGKNIPYKGRTIRLTAVRDITERKRAEEALRASEKKYRNLFEESRDTIYITTKEGEFIDINQAGLELFCYTKEGLMGLNVQEIYVDPEDRTKFQQEIERKGFIRDYDIKFRKKDGTEIDCLLTSTVRQAKDGSILGYQGIIRDITERKRVEAERERLLADLEAKNRELESFVYTVSHDLKAPLVSLSGFSAALHKELYSQLSEEGKHCLERIQANVDHMGSLIGSLLELSRIGRVVGAIEEVDVAALLRDIRDKLAAGLEKARAEFIVQEPLPTVRADRGRMRQVFANLIDNAVKFRSAERALRIEVGCQQEGSFYRFHVADNGIGIAPQYHEQIFALFRSLHPEIEGTGMGLAIVKKIVEHHGGRVWVQSPSAWVRTSDEGTGATFYFTLPIERRIKPRSRGPKPEGLS